MPPEDENLNNQDNVNTNTPSFQDMIPEAYKGKEYLQNVTSFDSLLDQYENAQKLIGKKSIPTTESSDEEWNEFYNKLRPETADKYEFTLQDGQEENKEFTSKIKEIFHEAGLSSKQAKLIQEKYDGLLKEMGPNQEELDKEFDDLSKKVFGTRQDEAIKVSKGLLDKYAPEEMKPFISELGNKELVILSSVLDKISSKFISEDKIPGQGGNDTNTTTARERARELMRSDAYKDVFHPEHNSVREKIKNLYKSMN